MPFDKTSLAAPVGSGPYVVSAISPGHSITFVRIKNYWAQDLPSQKGLNNFDTITIDVYRDDVVALEGIKSGQFDYYEEFIARNWATAYNIPPVRDGRLIKVAIPHRLPRGMQAFIFNEREAKFADPRVREAIDLTLDFEWMDRTLFYGAYTRSQSFFQNTDFASSGVPQGAELALLAPYRDRLPPQLFTTPYVEPVTDGTGSDRANLIRAQQLLDDAGWVMKDGHRVNAATGEKLTVEFLMTQRTFERVIGIMRHNLKRLGIDSSFRYVDESQYQRRVDKRQFDIVSIWWNQGLFYPGSEQYAFWDSSQADIEGSQNLGGVKDPVVDALVQKILHAKDLNELLPASRALTGCCCGTMSLSHIGISTPGAWPTGTSSAGRK
ncbi:MAG: extracellular solute-binding protein [Alphaproteobacteria bacterium]